MSISTYEVGRGTTAGLWAPWPLFHFQHSEITDRRCSAKTCKKQTRSGRGTITSTDNVNRQGCTCLRQRAGRAYGAGKPTSSRRPNMTAGAVWIIMRGRAGTRGTLAVAGGGEHSYPSSPCQLFYIRFHYISKLVDIPFTNARPHIVHTYARVIALC